MYYQKIVLILLSNASKIEREVISVYRVVVAGCRGYTDYKQAEQFINESLGDRSPATLVFLSGGCRGADMLGERYAVEHGISVEQYLPNWRRYGRGAGVKRNREMVDSCDEVICFWDGTSRGTKSLIDYAHRMGKPVRIKRISSQPSL